MRPDPTHGHRPWSGADDARIVAMRAEGRTDVEIGAACDRTPSAINSRLSHLRKAGVDVEAMRRWTEGELARLIDLREAGVGVDRIAALLGRGRHSVSERNEWLVQEGALDGVVGVDRDHVRRLPVDDALLQALRAHHGHGSAA